MSTIILLSALFCAQPDTVVYYDSVPEDVNIEQMKMADPYGYDAYQKKRQNPNGWRYNLEEYMKLMVFPEAPEYFLDPIHGSNDGYSLA